MWSIPTYRSLILVYCLTSLAAVGLAFGQELYIYPNHGQSAEKQSQDRYECHAWAAQQTGFDPTMAQATQSPTPPPPRGGAVRGAARGAAVGAVGGAIGGDAGKGAAIGAGTGALIGGMRRRSAVREEMRLEEQQQATTNQRREAYDRALAACLAGRGYTVR
jgi:Glycine-zipper domain